MVEIFFGSSGRSREAQDAYAYISKPGPGPSDVFIMISYTEEKRLKQQTLSVGHNSAS